MKPGEQAAVEAAVRAVRAVRAHRRRGSGYGSRSGSSAAEILDERLELDWVSFSSRGFELLREVSRRASGRARIEGGEPDDHAARGARYEERYSPARERLARASV